MQHFQLDSTFFGFEAKHRVQNHENIFNLIWFGEGRWDWNDIYHMPVFLRSYWTNKCNEIHAAKEAVILKSKHKRSTRTSTPPTKQPR